ncbi:hypothetical protein GCK32_003263 [Trichostrongylus colubriformis]|uniref:Uncharacterized protein n=1 Tax=Trichostrongylus colubriformis TaxID=6319 RepID=A0AAN8FV60_TRICO
MDFKKEEYINLWKLCNIYSAAAVDVDDAMREIRNALRKRLKTKETSRDVSTFRRLIDEYRPMKKSAPSENQQEIYDKPTSKEKQRWLELSVFGRKKEEKKDTSNDDYPRKSKTMPKQPYAERSDTVKITVPAAELQPKQMPPLPPPPSNPPPSLNYEYSPGLYDTPIGPPPMRFQPPPPPAYPPPAFVPTTKKPELSITPLFLKEEQFDEVVSTPVPLKPVSGNLSLQQDIKCLELRSPSVFNVSEFLEQMDPPAGRGATKGVNEKPVTAEPAPDAPRQISPGTMYKPIAPPRPSAPSSRTPTSTRKNRLSTGSVPEANGSAVQNAVPIMQSHTRIEILPSYEEQSDHIQGANYECMTVDRRGILAKRHSIKIDTNSIKEPGVQRFDGSYLLSVPGSDYSIIVNNL